jgi:asparagine synthase (glutamine-hydrolysing)
MCGIFAYLSNSKISNELKIKLTKIAMLSKHRGPDNTVSRMVGENKYLVFHRLCINDLSETGNQPLNHPDDLGLTLICNGEIYNYQKLITDNSFKTRSNSDCEVILHMYKKYGIEYTVKNLDGVFAFVLIDNNLNKVYMARDPFGVRAMYLGIKDDNKDSSKEAVVVSSELKSVYGLANNIQQFKPGCYYELNEGIFHQYYDYKYTISSLNDETAILANIKQKLEKAVEKRLLSDRPIGCLLSGGLDSSLITALVARHYPKGHLKTFSVGMEGSVDLKYAKMVADFIGTDHHEVIFTEKQMLEGIEDDIKQIETYDTTTIRASTPMYLLCKYIKENTKATVIFSGEGSDEASGSYMYFKNAPNESEFQEECVRLMKDLCYYDNLRCDKSSAGAGLEVRVPFLDKDFLEYYMSILPKMKMPESYHIEKYLLRKAFDDDNLLPKEVLWRVKEAMSDGVSSQKRGWSEVIQEKVNNEISDEDFENIKAKYPWNPPQLKESAYFREIFNKNYPGFEHTIPYYWLPKWSGDVVDPSARVLDCYDKKKGE